MMRTRLGVIVASAGLALSCGGSGGDDDDTHSGIVVYPDRPLIPFGRVDLSARREETVTIRNGGAAEVAVPRVTLSGLGPFAIAANTCVGVIGAGDTCTVTIAATPVAVGPAVGALVLETSAHMVTVDLAVTGAAQITVSVTGPGRVKSAPIGIDCGRGGMACTAQFVETPVVLSADNDTTVRWTSGCEGNGDCSVVLDQARTVAATTYAPLRRTFNNDDYGLDACNAIAAGPSGMMLIAGEIDRELGTAGGDPGRNAWARAYDASGEVLWSHEIDTEIDGHDRAFDIIPYGDGALVAGTAYEHGTWSTGFLTRISDRGTRLWFEQAPDNRLSANHGLVRDDSSSRLIVTGWRSDDGPQAVTWVDGFERGDCHCGTAGFFPRILEGNPAGDDVANKSGADSQGNVFTAGYWTKPGTGRDGWIAKYAGFDNTEWFVSVAGDGTSADEATDVAAALDDSAVAVGVSDADGWIRALARDDGARLWNTTLSGTPLRGIAIDASGNVLVTGTRGTTLVVRKYTAAGDLIWERTAPNANGNGVAVDGDGNVLVCGAEVVGNKSNVLVLKLYQ